MTQTLGLIGAGMIGGGLARLATDAGLTVVISNSRGPESLAGLVADLGPAARATDPAGVAEAADLVVATVPLHAYRSLPALTGKIVIDTMNHYPDRDGDLPEFTGPDPESVVVQRHLSGARVVKAFNNIDFRRLVLLARPTGAPDRSGLPIAGDDPAAKQTVTALLDALGYDAVDIGPLAESWRSEPGTPVYVQPYSEPWPEGLSPQELQQWFFGSPGVPVPAARIKDLVAAATRPA